MIESLKMKLIESEHPVGIKKTNRWVLPPKDFAYGRKETPDKEGADILTRSWKVHNQSKFTQDQQDFITINKLAISKKAISHKQSRDFRNEVDIKQKINKGRFERKIYLPAENFVYGQRNRTPTPIKQIVNYDYSRRAENEILSEYNAFMKNKKQHIKYEPKSTNHLDKLLQARRNIEKKEEKPLFKMKMFSNVGSKVVDGIKNFKTYDNNSIKKCKNENDNDAQIDNMIEKIENELKQLQTNPNVHVNFNENNE